MAADDVLVFTIYGDNNFLYVFDKNALTFTKVTVPDTHFWQGVANDSNGNYVATSVGAGASCVVYSSDNGSTWNTSTWVSGVTGEGYATRFDRTREFFFMLLSGSYMPLSTDSTGSVWLKDSGAGLSGTTVGHDIVAMGEGRSVGVALFYGGFAVGYKGVRMLVGDPTTAYALSGTIDSYMDYDCYEHPIPGITGNDGFDMIPRLLAGDGDRFIVCSNAGASPTHLPLWGELSETVGSAAMTMTQGTLSGDPHNVLVAVHGYDYWISGGAESFGYSADGKAWTGVADAALSDWVLNDGVYDGTDFWFTAGKLSDSTAAAIFKYDPGVDYTSGTWTRYDVTDSPGAMAWVLTGYPAAPTFLEFDGTSTVTFTQTSGLDFMNFSGTGTITFDGTSGHIRIPGDPPNSLFNIRVISGATGSSKGNWAFIRDNSRAYTVTTLDGASATVTLSSLSASTSDLNGMVSSEGNTVRIKGRAHMTVRVNYVPNDLGIIRRVHPIMPYPDPDSNGNP